MTARAGTAAARTGAPLRRPIAPRRVSGPVRHPRAVPQTGRIDRLIDHSLLDRLIRGRTWIGLIAFALIGIVTMQVALLKLNTGIGRAMERATVLQLENAQLAAQVSELARGDRITSLAAAQGMVYDPAGDVRYVTAGRGDAARAAAFLTAPSLASLQSSSTTPSSPSSTAPMMSAARPSAAAALAAPAAGTIAAGGSAATTVAAVSQGGASAGG